jgi:ferredoxin
MKKGIIRKDKFGSWVEKLKERGDVFGPRKKDTSWVFDSVVDPNELDLEYPRTILPPKKYFFPPKDEVLLEYNTSTGEVTAPKLEPDKEIILLGVHACDMQGLLRLDICFEEGNPDSTYLARRAKSTIIGVTCVPDEYCFCSSVGSNNHKDGFDIFLSDLGQNYLAESFTDKGDELLDLTEASEATMFDEELAYKAKARCSDLKGEQIRVRVEEIPLLCMTGEDLAFWEDDIARRCLACGSCTNVCPTCYCFDVRDNIELNLTEGQRLRFWDSCQLEGFTEVAGGEKFMKDQATRQKHRFYRKFRYLTTKYGGQAFCVGCGRCFQQCPAEIGIVEIANKLNTGIRAMK